VQVRGIKGDTAHEGLVGAATRLGLLPSPAHDRARNISMSPTSTLGWLVRSLDEAICARPELTRLGGRFLFAVDDGSGGSGLASSDVGALVGDRDAELVIQGRLTAVSSSLGELAEQLVEATFGFDLELGPVVRVPEQRLPLGQRGHLLVVAAPLQRLTSDQLRGLADLVLEARIAPAGRLVLVGGTLEAAGLLGLLTDPEDPRADVTACSGLGCARALVDVRALAEPVGSPVHWVGCERRCGLPADASARIAS
jgi:precorrin-3B synthase